MWFLALLPFCLQAIAIAFDELYFHLRRGLPLWERIGHPLDTLSLLLCFFILLFLPYNDFNLKIYIGCSLFSCLMVTKDEFIHKHHSPAAENWLHALLFILHPINLIVAAFFWPISQGLETAAPLWLQQPEPLKIFLYVQASAIFLFFIYQFVFWNFIWKNKPVIRQ